MNDIRSHRDELHPLPVATSAAYEHRAALDDLAVAPSPGDPRADERQVPVRGPPPCP